MSLFAQYVANYENLVLLFRVNTTEFVRNAHQARAPDEIASAVGPRGHRRSRTASPTPTDQGWWYLRAGQGYALGRARNTSEKDYAFPPRHW